MFVLTRPLGQPAEEVEIAGRLEAAVALDAVPIENRLNIAQETDGARAPRRQQWLRGREGGRERVRCVTRCDTARFMTSGTGALFSRLQTDETSHPPQFHPVLIEQLKIDRRVRRHSEVNAPVRFDRYVT